MAKLTWLGEDGPDVPGPSFTTCFGRKFHVGVAVEVNDIDMIKRAKGNRFFRVEDDTTEIGPEDQWTPEEVARPLQSAWLKELNREWTPEEVATLEKQGQVVKRRGRPPKHV